MQESLVAEDHYYQDELEQHRKLKLQELHRELSAKEQQNQQAQETIKSQVHKSVGSRVTVRKECKSCIAST